MKKEGDKWITKLLLPPGTFSYKFVVDDRWCFDIEKPNFMDTFSGSANNTISIEDWRSELISERSKNRYQIQEEVTRKLTAEFEARKKKLEEETETKIQNLSMELQAKHSHIATLIQQKTNLEETLKATNEKLEETRKTLSGKRALIEADVRQKYESFVNALHNEMVQIKLQLETERNLHLEYKKKYESEKGGNGTYPPESFETEKNAEQKEKAVNGSAFPEETHLPKV